MKTEEIANQYKGRCLVFRIKKGRKTEDTILQSGEAKMIALRGRVRRLQKIKQPFDLVELLSWSRKELRQGALR